MNNRWKILELNANSYSIENILKQHEKEYNIHSINMVPPPSFQTVRISDMGTGSYEARCIIVLESKDWNFKDDLHEVLK